MTIQEELAEARRLLGFVYQRSKHGLFSFRRSERDKALSDVNYWTGRFAPYWEGPGLPSRDRIWMGERP